MSYKLPCPCYAHVMFSRKFDFVARLLGKGYELHSGCTRKKVMKEKKFTIEHYMRF